MFARHVTTRISGLIILIAGIWAGLIPFLGPYFHFTLGPDKAWTWTTGRLWLVVLPAIAAVLGGLILMGGGPRLSGRFGALLALAGGAWFAIGPDVSRWWNHGATQLGASHGHHAITRMLEYLTLHSGVGVLIAVLAAYALPGAAAYAFGRRRTARDAAIAGTGAAAGAEAERHHRDRVAEREAAGAGTGTAAGAGAAGAGTAGAGTAGAGEGVGATRAGEGAGAAGDGPGATGTGTAGPGATGTGTAGPGAAGAGAAGAGVAGAGATEGAAAPMVGGHPADPAAPAPGATGGTGAGTATRRRRGGLFSRR